MPDLISALRRNAGACDGTTALSDGRSSLTHAGLSARVAGFAATLTDLPKTLGLLGDNSVDWVVAQLAGWVAGKVVVPIPAFFSPQQQQHVLADCGLTHAIITSRLAEQVRQLGATPVPVTDACLSELLRAAVGWRPDHLYVGQHRAAQGRATGP